MADHGANSSDRLAAERSAGNAGDGRRGPANEARFTAAGAALFRLLDAVDALERSAAEMAASRGRLGLLRELARRGPRTMSALARARGTSRQAVQRLAHSLERDAVVEILPNPGDRRAPLLALTARGWQAYRELAHSEAVVLNRAARGLEARDLHAAARLLRGAREHPDGRALRPGVRPGG